jgi:tRNA(Arg) A34 adenosine deaminase TadA
VRPTAAVPTPASTGWAGLPPAWQLCWREAMAAWQHGAAPISAAVLGDEGQVLALGRNHLDDATGSGSVRHHALAHAEVNALLAFDSDLVDGHQTLYALLEPCPACLGMFYMSGIRRLAVAARDPWAGSTNLLGTTPCLALKPIRLQSADLPVLAAAVSVMHTVWRKRLYPRASGDPVIDRWLTAQPGPTQLGLQLWRDGWAAERQATAGDQAAALYDELAVLCSPLLDKDMA